MFQAFFYHPLSRTVLLFSLMVTVISLLAMLLAPLLLPIIISFALYALLEPFSSMLERQGLSRTSSSLGVLLVLVLIAVLVISLLMPHLSSQFSDLQKQLPVIWNSLGDFVNKFTHFIAHSIGLNIQTSSLTQPFFEQADEWIKKALIEGSNALISLTVLMVLVPIFTFFLVRDFEY